LAEAEAAVMAVEEAEAVIAPAQPRELRSSAPDAASKPRCHLSPEEIVRCFAAIASRRKRAVPAGAADADAAATIAVDAAAVVVAATNSLR
jgi:hypothetical protein